MAKEEKKRHKKSPSFRARKRENERERAREREQERASEIKQYLDTVTSDVARVISRHENKTESVCIQISPAKLPQPNDTIRKFRNASKEDWHWHPNTQNTSNTHKNTHQNYGMVLAYH